MKKQVKTIKGFSTKETAQVVDITKLETVKGGEGQTVKVAIGSPTDVPEFFV
jgi:hypothetical protein